MKDEDIFNLIKKNSHETLETPTKATLYYLKSFKKMLQGIFVFNISAFLFGTFWMFYRKMYLLGCLFSLLTLYLPIPYMVMNTMLGFLANHLYYMTLKEAKFNEVKSLGVNRWINPFIILLIISLIMFFLSPDASLTPEIHPDRRIA